MQGRQHRKSHATNLPQPQTDRAGTTPTKICKVIVVAASPRKAGDDYLCPYPRVLLRQAEL